MSHSRVLHLCVLILSVNFGDYAMPLELHQYCYYQVPLSSRNGDSIKACDWFEMRKRMQRAHCSCFYEAGHSHESSNSRSQCWWHSGAHLGIAPRLRKVVKSSLILTPYSCQCRLDSNTFSSNSQRHKKDDYDYSDHKCDLPFECVCHLGLIKSQRCQRLGFGAIRLAWQSAHLSTWSLNFQALVLHCF